LGDGDWFDIEQLGAEYVVYTRPYNELPYVYNCHNLTHKYKLCYIPYAYAMTEGTMFYATFENTFIRNMSYIFVPNKSRLELCRNEFYWYEKFGYCKFLFLGFPRFDLISGGFNGNDKRTVLWLPRWTAGNEVEGQKESNFLKYYNQFIQYFTEHKNINLIIRPHPLMFKNFIEKGIMSQEEVQAFKDVCSNSVNIELDESKDYLPSIKKSGILVADYTSLLAEYFVTGNPIIYCDDVDGLNKEAHLMDKAFYHADSFEEIKETIEKLCNNKDNLVSLREQVRKEIIPPNAGSVGMEIINAIL
jgi:CDP-glycerol glycerophosphotransferase (TagB/SpsB family)